jgi:hypothetical protein
MALLSPEPRIESNVPVGYRLIRKLDGNGGMEYVLQGKFTWREGRSHMGHEWRDLETQEWPYLDEPDWGACDQMKCDIELYTDHQSKRSNFLAIATELEKING